MAPPPPGTPPSTPNPPPPPGPILIGPDDNADLYHLYDSYRWVRLSWQPVGGATKYQVCLGGGVDLGCGDGPITRFWDNLTATELTLSHADMVVPAGAPAGTEPLYGRWLKWGVRACNSSGQCGTSAVRNLWIRFPPANLVSPGDDYQATSRRPQFQWNAVPGAAGYAINISSLTDPWGHRQQFIVNGGNTTSHTPAVDIENTGSTGFFWSVTTCKPMDKCGFSGKDQDDTQRWVTLPAFAYPQVSFANHLYPLLQPKCLMCHPVGGGTYPDSTAGRVNDPNTPCNETLGIQFNNSLSAAEVLQRFKCSRAMSGQAIYSPAYGKVYVVPGKSLDSGLHHKAQLSDSAVFSENFTIGNVTKQIKEWITIWIEQGGH
jgi:hypothetical protein